MYQHGHDEKKVKNESREHDEMVFQADMMRSHKTPRFVKKG